MREAKISEIFLSLQGEGLYFGVPQLFIRFYGCELSCNFCDTKFDTYKTFTPDSLMSKILEFQKPYHSVSLTGGEPLEEADFIADFLGEYKKFYRKLIYLETNGILYKELSRVINYVDIIAMDFKLPSATKEESFWKAHEKFLEIAVKVKTFVKAVVTPDTRLEDITCMLEIVKKIDKKIPVVLQPATPEGDSEKINRRTLKEFRDILKNRLERVEIIPQVHKMLGIK